LPTGLDVRPDSTLDLYYRVVDSRIGVERIKHTGLPSQMEIRAT
jgi:hypothetical protein